MKFTILDETGDTVVEYDVTKKDQLRLAEKHFNALQKDGKQMIGIDKNGGSFMSGQFDKTAVEYVVGNRLAGG